MKSKGNEETGLVPELRFGEFGGGWEPKNLGSVSDNFEYGLNKSAVPFNGSDKYIRITDIDDKTNEFSPDPLMSPEGVHDDQYLLKEGDIVIARTGASVGKSYLFKKADGRLLFAGFLIRTSINENYSAPFIHLKLLTQSYWRYIQVVSMRSGQPGVNIGELEKYEFFVPTLPEQRKIASFLSLVDRRLAAARRRVGLLGAYKDGVVQRLFTGEIGVSDSGPEHEPTFLRGLLQERKERNEGSKYQEVFSVAKEAGVINQIEHLGRSYASDDISNYKVVHPGDVIYTKSPTSGFPFGIIKQNQTGRIGVVSVLYAVYKPKTYELGTLLQNYFLSPVRTYNYLVPIVRKGAKNPMNVNNAEFLVARKVPVPPPAEQTRIATILTTLDARLALAEREVAGWEAWKRGLLGGMLV